MLLSEYLKLRNGQGGIAGADPARPRAGPAEDQNADGDTFAQALQRQLDKIKGDGVAFSGHAIKRIDSRSVDLASGDKVERLNRGVELAANKGSNSALVLVDSTAFVVSVKNNTVITTMERDEIEGNVFTNIDSAIII